MFPGTGVGSGPCPAQPRAMQRGNLAYGVGITSPSLSRLVTPGEFLTSEQRDTHSLTAQDLNPFSPGARSRAWPLRDAIPGVSCATSPLNVLFTFTLQPTPGWLPRASQEMPVPGVQARLPPGSSSHFQNFPPTLSLLSLPHSRLSPPVTVPNVPCGSQRSPEKQKQ